MEINKKLQTVLQRVAASEPLQGTSEDVLEILDNYEANTQEIVDFLEAMVNYPEGEARAEVYLAHVREHQQEVWKELVQDNNTAAAAPAKETPAKETPADDTTQVSAQAKPTITHVGDPASLTAEAELDMVLFGSDSDNPCWSVFANAQPMAAIYLQDQRNADTQEMKELFVSDQYKDLVLEGCASPIGAKETLTELKARWYASVVDESDLAAKAEERAASKLEDSFAERLANLKESLLNHANLAITASMKGMFVDNPLRNQLVHAFQKANVANGDEVVNEIFEVAGQEFFSGIIAQAEKWMGYSPEAMGDLTKEILAAKTVLPKTEEQEVRDMQRHARSASHDHNIVNVPIVTRNNSTGDYREDTKQRLGSLLSRRNRR